nr:peroxidase 1 [Tanacetum cinerariifolium]
GCDASNLIQSSGSEKDHEDNLSLAKDGFDIVNQAKAAVDAVPSFKKKVSCADILTMATKDVIKMEVVCLCNGLTYAFEIETLGSFISIP